ncbi:clathrin coat assembly protein, putative [Ixodes scapularis]|uniref:Clathrin coat assembly protein, putative n=1 Tax=Ixodes scapularis TaxID=6945 RepID=B7Q5X2_IXOSC|nr:clathrin coat assembly protein, putative [Ixodes scapularis]|eukprot:XP_002411827.1 clathrin coat assembly protein, putative [Ixodes scapularis]
MEIQPKLPMAVTNAVSWRSEGIKYRKNEVFLDVIESVNLLANANGNVLRSEIVGCIKMRVYLSGMPELRLGLNDKVLFESTGPIYILDLKGKVLISRNYRGDIDMSSIDKFMTLLMEKEEEGCVTPIMRHADIAFMYIKHNNLYLVSTSKKNANVALIFAFLHKIVTVIFGRTRNFYVTRILKKISLYFLFVGGVHSTLLDLMPVTRGAKSRCCAVSTTRLDLILLGVKLWCSITSRHMKLQLDTVTMLCGKSKSVELEDVKFHQCVRLSRFENDRTISFIPPDGEFELMSYRLNTHVKPLIWIESVIERHAHSRVEYMVKAKSQFKRRSTANNVEIVIPVPTDADTPKFKTTVGNVKYAPEQSAVVWSIKSFPGGKEYLMRAHFGLPSVESEETEGRAPIQVKFEIPYFTTSGIQVRYLKIIEKSGYQALPWVRYITQNGDYQLRTN